MGFIFCCMWPFKATGSPLQLFRTVFSSTRALCSVFGVQHLSAVHCCHTLTTFSIIVDFDDSDSPLLFSLFFLLKQKRASHHTASLAGLREFHGDVSPFTCRWLHFVRNEQQTEIPTPPPPKRTLGKNQRRRQPTAAEMFVSMYERNKEYTGVWRFK